MHNFSSSVKAIRKTSTHVMEEPFISPILRIIRKSKVLSFSAVLKLYDLPEVSLLIDNILFGKLLQSAPHGVGTG